MRPDLAQVGIAEGLAGFSVYIPIANVQLDTDIEITIHDALGARCALTCPAGRVTDYEPRGYIDSLDGSLITGWVFDPLLLYSFEAPSLHFRYEQICQLQLTLERPDLLSDSGDGLKTFGFEVASAILIEEMARQKFTPGQAGLLTLVSSGYELSALSVTLEHDKSLSSLRALETAAGGRVPVSDWLDASLKTQKIPATKAGRRK
jgi:hypothetical protein